MQANSGGVGRLRQRPDSPGKVRQRLGKFRVTKWGPGLLPVGPGSTWNFSLSHLGPEADSIDPFPGRDGWILEGKRGESGEGTDRCVLLQRPRGGARGRRRILFKTERPLIQARPETQQPRVLPRLGPEPPAAVVYSSPQPTESQPGPFCWITVVSPSHEPIHVDIGWSGGAVGETISADWAHWPACRSFRESSVGEGLKVSSFVGGDMVDGYGR